MCIEGTQDYYAEDELTGFERRRPPFGTELHRWLSTVRRLQAQLEKAKADPDELPR